MVKAPEMMCILVVLSMECIPEEYGFLFGRSCKDEKEWKYYLN
jgi:hypothetical protein